MSEKRFKTEKSALHDRVSDRMRDTLNDLEKQDKLVRDMEASVNLKPVKEPPYK